MVGLRAGRAVVIGGSMSGLLSGISLRRAGWDVDIYERVEGELSGRGAGIVAQQDLIERLRALGFATDDLGVQITTRKILDAQGRLSETIKYPQVLTAWERVYRLLRDAFPPGHYHRGRGLAKFTQGAGSCWRISPMVQPSKQICWSAPTDCVRPFASNAYRRRHRSIPAIALGAR